MRVDLELLDRLAGVMLMETESMGRVVTEATFENLEDLWEAKRGLRPTEQVRRLTVDNALGRYGSHAPFAADETDPATGADGTIPSARDEQRRTH